MSRQHIETGTHDADVVELGCEFTPREAASLAALRERHRVQPDYVELGLDIHRLEFARWLVRTGRIGEECAAEE